MIGLLLSINDLYKIATELSRGLDTSDRYFARIYLTDGDRKRILDVLLNAISELEE